MAFGKPKISVQAASRTPPPPAPVEVAPILANTRAGVRTDVAGQVIADSVSNSTIVSRPNRAGLTIKPLM